MIRAEGQKFWAAQNPRKRQLIDLRGADFSGQISTRLNLTIVI